VSKIRVIRFYLLGVPTSVSVVKAAARAVPPSVVEAAARAVPPSVSVVEAAARAAARAVPPSVYRLG
jgi:hypothetical protein